jgi:hypothetical protein
MVIAWWRRNGKLKLKEWGDREITLIGERMEMEMENGVAPPRPSTTSHMVQVIVGCMVL